MINEFAIINLFLFAASFYVLFYAGGLMVRSLSWIGRFLHVSEFMLSFVLAAFATSLPELFVGINSALHGVSALSVGNVVGANFLNMTLVIGVAAVVARGLPMDRNYAKKNLGLGFTMIIFPMILLLDGYLSRIDGAVLLLLFGGYLSFLIAHEEKNSALNAMRGEEYRVSLFFKKLILFFVGLGLLLGSAWFIVDTGVVFAGSFHLPLYFIGILVAIGTTLPEMVFGIRSAIMRHADMAIGNAFGSIAVNTSLILGMVAVIHPVQLDGSIAISSIIFLTAAVGGLVHAVDMVRGRISRGVGFLLIGLAAAFLVVSGLFL